MLELLACLLFLLRLEIIAIMVYVILLLVLVQFFFLYQEIMHDISLVEIEEIDVTIKLANRDTISPLEIIRDVEVLYGKIKYSTNFLVLGSHQDNFCLIIFGRPFLNTVGAEIDCAKQKVKV